MSCIYNVIPRLEFWMNSVPIHSIPRLRLWLKLSFDTLNFRHSALKKRRKKLSTFVIPYLRYWQREFSVPRRHSTFKKIPHDYLMKIYHTFFYLLLNSKNYRLFLTVYFLSIASLQYSPVPHAPEKPPCAPNRRSDHPRTQTTPLTGLLISSLYTQ